MENATGGKPGLVDRAKNMLLTPKTEWPVVAEEPATVKDIYLNYVLILSALPAVATFVKVSLIGISVPFAGTVRVGIGAGLSQMLVQYGLGLVAVYVLAWIVNALAPTFSGQQDMVRALKTTAYAYTAGWVAGVLVILPWLGWLLAFLGGLYSIYLLYLGLPHTMRSPPEKSLGYTVVVIIVAIVFYLVIGMIAGKIGGAGGMSGLGASSSSDIQIDPDSPLGKLEAMGKQMEAAGKKMEEAQKAGDQEAQMKAAGEALGALFGGGQQVEALAPEQLKPFVPETLDGMPRSDYSVERNSAMGLQIAEAKASYRDDANDKWLNLEITDMGSTKGFAALAGWAMVESEQESDTGYERVYRKDGRMVHEQYDNESKNGTYGVIVGERFNVEVQGEGYTMDQLKDIADDLDLKGLEALKSHGVKPASG